MLTRRQTLVPTQRESTRDWQAVLHPCSPVPLFDSGLNWLTPPSTPTTPQHTHAHTHSLEPQDKHRFMTSPGTSPIVNLTRVVKTLIQTHIRTHTYTQVHAIKHDYHDVEWNNQNIIRDGLQQVTSRCCLKSIASNQSIITHEHKQYIIIQRLLSFGIFVYLQLKKGTYYWALCILK